MGLTNEHVGSKKPAKINTYMLTRAELLITLCYEIPCKLYDVLFLVHHWVSSMSIDAFYNGHVWRPWVNCRGNKIHSFHLNDKSGISIWIIFRKFGFQSPEMSKVYDLYYVGSVFKVVFSKKLLEYPFYSKNAQFFTTFFEKVGADYEQLFVVFFHVLSDKRTFH